MTWTSISSRTRTTTVASPTDLPSPFLVLHDGVDWDIFDFLRSRIAIVRTLAEERSTFTQINEFLFETFALFFKEAPELVPEAERPEDAYLRGKFLEVLIATPAYYTTVAEAALDEFVSVHAAVRVTEELLAFVRQLGRQWLPVGGDLPSEVAEALAAAFAGALAGARGERQALDDFATGWGTNPGELRRLPVHEKFALMEKLQHAKGLRDLSELAGRTVEICRRKRGDRTPSDHGDVTGVALGGELARVLPSEFALLSRPRLRRLFHLRLAERSLAVLEFKPRVALGRGPLVVCIDTSGSMQMGHRETWSKAVACALYTQAREDRRTFAYMHFSSKHELRQVVVRRDEPHGTALDRLTDIATYAFGGGTDFDRPLNAALDLIETESELQRADIVFISDGECGVSPIVQERIAQAKQQRGLSVIGVLVQEHVDRQEVDERIRTARSRNAERGAERDEEASLAVTLPSFIAADPAARRRAIVGLRQMSSMGLGYEDPLGGMLSFCDHLYPITELTAEAAASIVDPFLS